MNRTILWILLLAAAYGGYRHFSGGSGPVRAAVHDNVIMYALVTCGYCKAKANELRERRIAFKEYYIDKDAQRREELNDKLRRAGYPPRTYGTPIMDVRGWILPGNPSVDEIVEYMAKADSDG